MSLTKLLLYRLKISLANLTRGAGRRRLTRVLTLVAIMGGGGGGVTVGMFVLFKALNQTSPDGFLLSSMLLAMAFHALLILAFVFDMATTMNIFFLSSDLDLLMSAPISSTKVFSIKYLDALISSSLIMVIFGIPLMVAFGLAISAPVAYYILLLPIAYIFLSIPVSIGIVVGLVVSRYVSPRRVREILAFVGTLMGIGFWLAMQFLRRSILASHQMQSAMSIPALMEKYVSHPLMRMLPSQLAASALSNLARGSIFETLHWLLTLLAISSILLLFSVLLAKRIYLTGWARTRSVGGKRRIAGRGWFVDRLLRFLPSFERSVTKITLRMYLRDPQQLAPLISIVVVVMLIPFLSGVPGGRIASSPLLALESVIALAFIGSLNVASHATVIDGKCFWFIVAAPVSPLRKILSKLVATLFLFMPIVIIVSFAFGFTGLTERSQIPKFLIAGFALGAAGASIGVFLGISYGNWEWEIPKRMLRARGRVILTVILASFFGSMSLTASTVARIKGSLAVPGWSLIALVTLGAVALLLFFLLLSTKKLRNMEWTKS